MPKVGAASKLTPTPPITTLTTSILIKTTKVSTREEC